MRRPVIGIVCHSLAEGATRPAALAVGRKYADVLRSVGAVPWLIALAPDDADTFAEVMARLDGLFLAGGTDVDPARYGEPRHPKCGATDPDRDATEFALLRMAVERTMPVLAVCRGLQVMNAAFGGTLYQDIAAQVPAALNHEGSDTARAAISHEVTVASGSRLAEILGESYVGVNSLHHQAIKHLAPTLRATAFAPDGIIEGVEGTGSFLVGVQWHPEELAGTRPEMRRLFAAFVEAAQG